MSGAVDIKDADKVLKSFAGKIQTITRNAVMATGLRVKNYIVDELIPKTKDHIPVDRGLYRAGWKVARINPSGGGIGARVYNAAPHAIFIEKGVQGSNVKPGKKMLEALAEWVKRKGLVGKATKKNQASRDANARSIAYAIAISMKQKGIFDGGKGLRHLEIASKKIPKFLSEELAREIARIKK